MTMLDGADAHRYARRHLGFFTYWRCRIQDFVMNNLQKNTTDAAWRPIATAPKDGSMIIAHNAVIGGTYVVGWHKGNLPKDLEDVPHWSDVPNQNAADALWFNCLYFTHWMPLPTAPNAK